MTLTKACRRWIASVLAVLLLGLQLSVAAYACPAASPPEAMAGMPGCEHMSFPDTEQPQLCKAHCDRDRQTVNHAPTGELPPVVLQVDRLCSRLALWLPTAAAGLSPALVAAQAGPPDGAPPVYLTLQVLRR